MLTLVLLLALALPTAARAQDTYTVHHCQTPDGGLGSVEGLSPVSGAAGLGRHVSGERRWRPARRCASSRTLEGFGIRYRVPADTRLARYTLYRTVGLSPGWNYSLFRDADALTEENRVEICWTMAAQCAARGDGRVSTASRVARHGAGHGRPHALASTAIPARARPAAARA